MADICWGINETVPGANEAMSEVVTKFEGLTAKPTDCKPTAGAPRKKELTDEEKRYSEIAKGYEAAIQAIFVKLDTTSAGSLVSVTRWRLSSTACRL